MISESILKIYATFYVWFDQNTSVLVITKSTFPHYYNFPQFSLVSKPLLIASFSFPIHKKGEKKKGQKQMISIIVIKWSIWTPLVRYICPFYIKDHVMDYGMQTFGDSRSMSYYYYR